MTLISFIHKKRLQKTMGLISLIVFFTVVYSFLDSSHFQGINPLQDKIKDNIVEKQVDNDPHLETFSTNASFEKKMEVKDNVEEVVKEDEKKINNPSVIQDIFDRFYFSTTTACLLGYGDVYPATNAVKILSALQAFLTVVLILY